MRVTVVLVFLATSVLAHNGTSTQDQGHQEPWSPMPQQSTTMRNKRGEANTKRNFVDTNQHHIIYIDPSHSSHAQSPNSHLAHGTQGNQQLVGPVSFHPPGHGEVINTTQNVETEERHEPVSNVHPRPITDQTALHQAGSGVVLQIHPQYLKSFPANPNQHNLKHIQGNFAPHVGSSFAHPQGSGTDLALQIQPQFVVTGIHNPALLHKQFAAPILYNQPIGTAPVSFNYQNNVLGGIKPGQHLGAPITLQNQNPTVLTAPFHLPAYGQGFQTNPKQFQPLKLQVQNQPLRLGNGNGFPGNEKLTNFGNVPVRQVEKPTANLIFGQTKENLAGHNVGGSTNGDDFADFSKMFDNYFKTGPFGQAFKNDESAEGTNLRTNPSGGFFGGSERPQASSSNQEQDDDGEYKPCNFFKTANSKLVENNNPDHFGSNNKEKHNPEKTDDESDEDDVDSSNTTPSRAKYQPNKYYGPSEGERHRGYDDDDERSAYQSSNNQHPQPVIRQPRPNYSNSHEERPKRPHGDNDDDDDDNGSYRSSSTRQQPNQSQGYGHGSSHYQNDDGYSGRPSNRQRVNRPSDSDRPEDKRPRYNHQNDDDGYSHQGEQSRPHNEGSGDYDGRSQYRQEQAPYRQHQDSPRPHHHRHHQQQQQQQQQQQNEESKTSEGEPKTFHRYYFPPTPAYPHFNTERGPPPSSGHRTPKRPPPQVREQDTVGYYTVVKPVGTSGIFYRSEKQMVTTNSSGMR